MAKWKIEIEAEAADATVELGKFINKEKEVGAAARQVGDAMTQQGRKTDEVGAKTGRTTRQLGGMSSVLGRLGKEVRGYVAGWLGLNAIRAAITAHISDLEKLHSIQLSIVATSQTTANQVAGASTQIFGATGTANIDATARIAGRIAAESGSTLGQGIAFARAGDLNFGGLVDAQGNVRESAVASTVQAAKIAQSLNLTNAAEQTEFFAILKQVGAKTPQQVSDASAILAAGFRSSEAPSFGAFAGGLGRSGLPALLAAGLSLEDAVRLNVRSRAVATGEQAPGFARTFFQAALGIRGGEKGRAFLEEQAGARGLTFADLTGQEKIALFQDITQKEIAAGRTAQLGELFGGTEVVQSLALAQQTGTTAAAAFGDSLKKTLPVFDALVDTASKSISAEQRRIEAVKELAEFEEGRKPFRVAVGREFGAVSEADLLRIRESTGRPLFGRSEEVVRETAVLQNLATQFAQLRTDDPDTRQLIHDAIRTIVLETLFIEGGPIGPSTTLIGRLGGPGSLFKTGARDDVLRDLVETLRMINDRLTGDADAGDLRPENPNR